MDKNTFTKILTKLDKIEKKLNKEEKVIDDYISQADAMKLFNRGRTWFWELIQAGFPYTKMGGKTYFLKKDFVKLLEDNTKIEWNDKTK